MMKTAARHFGDVSANPSLMAVSRTVGIIAIMLIGYIPGRRDEDKNEWHTIRLAVSA